VKDYSYVLFPSTLVLVCIPIYHNDLFSADSQGVLNEAFMEGDEFQLVLVRLTATFLTSSLLMLHFTPFFSSILVPAAAAEISNSSSTYFHHISRSV
jgi:hypothetical protein